ncbi:hypothetical protein BLNAU_2393 [Blattamonas nauphoetae]|uniref:Uncharacterized protein n=1 Tax=Blattamonas nauphoetae TaxID=2049346 RepID=A0ABQ9YFL5_9EUKA|nr:hypothetical protein BLNAU_2393 [Blattamonas nauphoetae]
MNVASLTQPQLVDAWTVDAAFFICQTDSCDHRLILTDLSSKISDTLFLPACRHCGGIMMELPEHRIIQRKQEFILLTFPPLQTNTSFPFQTSSSSRHLPIQVRAVVEGQWVQLPAVGERVVCSGTWKRMARVKEGGENEGVIILDGLANSSGPALVDWNGQVGIQPFLACSHLRRVSPLSLSSSTPPLIGTRPLVSFLKQYNTLTKRCSCTLNMNRPQALTTRAVPSNNPRLDIKPTINPVPQIQMNDAEENVNVSLRECLMSSEGIIVESVIGIMTALSTLSSLLTSACSPHPLFASLRIGLLLSLTLTLSQSTHGPLPPHNQLHVLCVGDNGGQIKRIMQTITSTLHPHAPFAFTSKSRSTILPTPTSQQASATPLLQMQQAPLVLSTSLALFTGSVAFISSLNNLTPKENRFLQSYMRGAASLGNTQSDDTVVIDLESDDAHSHPKTLSQQALDEYRMGHGQSCTIWAVLEREKENGGKKKNDETLAEDYSKVGSVATNGFSLVFNYPESGSDEENALLAEEMFAEKDRTSPGSTHALLTLFTQLALIEPNEQAPQRPLPPPTIPFSSHAQLFLLIYFHGRRLNRNEPIFLSDSTSLSNLTEPSPNNSRAEDDMEELEREADLWGGQKARMGSRGFSTLLSLARTVARLVFASNVDVGHCVFACILFEECSIARQSRRGGVNGVFPSIHMAGHSEESEWQSALSEYSLFLIRFVEQMLFQLEGGGRDGQNPKTEEDQRFSLNNEIVWKGEYGEIFRALRDDNQSLFPPSFESPAIPHHTHRDYSPITLPPTRRVTSFDSPSLLAALIRNPSASLSADHMPERGFESSFVMQPKRPASFDDEDEWMEDEQPYSPPLTPAVQTPQVQNRISFASPMQRTDSLSDSHYFTASHPDDHRNTPSATRRIDQEMLGLFEIDHVDFGRTQTTLTLPLSTTHFEHPVQTIPSDQMWFDQPDLPAVKSKKLVKVQDMAHQQQLRFGAHEP